ncbi:MAG: hypothetical protein OEV26_00515, partial [Gallionella sp.]|nr:hypothetical protein [Gallionella sp.]
ETNEGNNTMLTTSGSPTVGKLVVTAPAVDLTMTALTMSANSVAAGNSLTVNDTMSNAGTSAMTVSSSYVYYYLSADNVITTADTRIGYRLVNGAVAAGGTSAATLTPVTIPSTVAAGSYYIGAIADATNVQTETNEGNNTMLTTSGSPTVGKLVVTAPAVDLTMTALTMSANSVVAGNSLTVNDTLTNAGTSAMTVSSSYVYYYLSADNVITTADTRIGYRLVNGAVAAGGTSAATLTPVTIPSTVAPGTYYIGAIADALNVQPETNEGNNTMLTTSGSPTAGTLIVTASAADLTMTALTMSANSVVAGNSLTVNDTMTNAGTSAMTANSSYVYYYLSADNVITTADTRIGYRYVGVALAAGGSSTAATTSVTIPVDTPPGTYYIGAFADGTNAQTEINEGNNTMLTTSGSPTVGTLVVTAVEIDLQMTALTASASTMTRGSSYTVNDTMTNVGTSAMTASSSYIYYFLSTDTTITAEDTFIGFRLVNGALAAGGNSSGTNTSITIPAGAATGTYYIGAIADAADEQPEINETNNTRATTAITVN